MNIFQEIVDGRNCDIVQENANVDGLSPGGFMSLFASASAKHYTLEHLLSPDIKTSLC